jgi:hypothetical protein
MNGLHIIDLKQASFMDKLLRREPQENAYVEINNLLACVPIFKIERESIERFLIKYDIKHEKARSRLLNFYSIILNYFLQNESLSNSEIERLNHLKHILSLEEKEVIAIHNNFVRPIYKKYVRKVIADGKLTFEESETLKKIAANLSIPDKYAKKLYINETSHYLHSALKESISDGMLSDKEEKELMKLAEDLKVELKFSENAKKNLERCRKLWRIYQGDLPEIKIPIKLLPNNKCFAFISATLFQVYNKEMPVKFSGYHEVEKQNGYGFHSGVFRNDELEGKMISFDDEGTLYFTSQMLLFKGTREDRYFYFKNLIGGSFYRNGLVIEQKRGRDIFFQFAGDIEALKLIFDSCMTRER